MDYSHEILMPPTEFLRKVREKIASYQPPKDKSLFDTSQEIDYRLVQIDEGENQIKIEKPAQFVQVNGTNTAGFITIKFQSKEDRTVLNVTFETSSMKYLGYIVFGILIYVWASVSIILKSLWIFLIGGAILGFTYFMSRVSVDSNEDLVKRYYLKFIREVQAIELKKS